MKTNRILLIIASTALSALFAFAQSPYTVKLRLGEITGSPSPYADEWIVPVYTDIFDANGDLVSPSSNYNYRWHKNTCIQEEGVVLENWGLWNTDWDDDLINYEEDCNSNTIYADYDLMVEVVIGGQSYFSQWVRLPDEGRPLLLDSATVFLDQKQAVSLRQVKENQNTAGSVGRKIGGGIYNYPAPFDFRMWKDDIEVFRGSRE